MPTNIPYAKGRRFWLGRNLQRGEREVYLYDHRKQHPDWKGAVTVSAGLVTRANVAGFGGFGTLVPSIGRRQARHAIVHIDTPATIYSERDSELIVLWVSTDQLRSNRHHVLKTPSRIVQFSMKDGDAYRRGGAWVDEFLSLSFEQAENLAGLSKRTCALAYENKFKHFLDIVLPGRVEIRIAFRLLCEAYLLAHDLDAGKALDGRLVGNFGLGEWITTFGEVDVEELSSWFSDERERMMVRAVFKAVEEGDEQELLAKVNKYLDSIPTRDG